VLGTSLCRWSARVVGILIVLVVLDGAAVLAAREPFGAFLSGKLPSVAPRFSSVKLEEAFPNVQIADPMGLTESPDRDWWLVPTKSGMVYGISAGAGPAESWVALDISGRTATKLDGAIYSVVLHPEFGQPASENARAFFIFYQYSLTNPNSTGMGLYVGGSVMNRLSRFEMKPGKLEADPASETVLIEQRDRGVWHQGGAMFIHPFDGFLYLALGDEGVAAGENNQIISNNLFGGVLRIDITSNPLRSHSVRRQPQNGTTGHYQIPNDNPFLDPGGGVLEEFYALGLRSPHTLVCDPATGDIWCGDVGGSLFEEINRIERGKNYEWSFREGYVAAHGSPPSTVVGEYQSPFFAYHRQAGPSGEAGDRSVICGTVYRGENLRDELYGKMIFGDNISGRIWSLSLEDNPADRRVELLAQIDGAFMTGLARLVADSSGEVYAVQLGEPGAIWKLTASENSVDVLPATLSETGVFSDLANLTPAAGFVPYEVNQSFWSDGAIKRRWAAIPNDGAPYGAGETAEMRQTGAWAFPAGTVFVKHFDLPVTNQLGPSSIKVETRLIAVDQNAQSYGVTYKWRSDQSDADIVLNAHEESISVTPEIDHQWYYPGPSDCRTCHNPEAGHLLGLNTSQLNRDRTAGGNQIEHWETEQLGAFVSDRGSSESWPQIARMDDESATLTERIKSYLDVNCSFCHRPGGRGPAFDARLETPAVFQGLVDAASTSSRAERKERLVASGDPAGSELLARIGNTAAAKMPPVGRNQIDHAAVELINAWVAALRTSSDEPGFAAHYYRGAELNVAVSAGLETQIDQDWGAASPSGDLHVDGFSVRWQGTFIAPATGDYFISAASDDGARVYVDGNLIVNSWNVIGLSNAEATVFLEASSEHDIAVEYHEIDGAASCSVVCRLNDFGPNLFDSNHVRVNRNLITINTQPVIGFLPMDNSQALLKFYAEGYPVGLEQSQDLKNWSHVAFPKGAAQMLLNVGDARFIRIAPQN
jgi:glucose/arabinose dehydrogenase/mono/diheme cytochrome c family protein